MVFRNRREAGQLLAEKLKEYAGKDALVFGLPRGGVVVGAEIAQQLNLPLEVIISRKIGHPWQPEFAVAAITENGQLVENKEIVATLDPEWFKEAAKKEQEEAKRRRERYLAGREPISAKAKTAILVDDGIATGLTVQAAIKDLQQRQPAEIVLAVPVIPPDTAERLAKEVNTVVALEIPREFAGAVGAYYESFPQVSDEEVIELLKEINQT